MLGDGGADGDAAIVMDAGRDADSDAGVDAGVDPLTLDCDLGSMRFDAAVQAPGGRAFALGVAVNTAYATYMVPSCKSGPDGNFGVRGIAIPSGGDVPTPRALAGLESGTCFAARDPAVAAITTGRVWTYHVRPDANGDQLYARDWAADESRQLSNMSGRVSSTTAAGVIGSTAVVGWASSDGPGMPSDIYLYRGGSASSELVVVKASAGQHVTSMAVGGLGSSDRNVAPLGVVAWVDETPDATGIYMRAVDEKTQAVDKTVKLSGRAGPASAVDVIAHDDGGAVLYTIATGGDRYEVRLLLLDAKAAPIGAEIKITSGNENARDAAIARYATGYAIAYRVVRADPESPAVIRIAFTDEQGNLAGTRDVAKSNVASSELRLALARDGRLFLAFEDKDETSSILRVVRAVCE